MVEMMSTFWTHYAVKMEANKLMLSSIHQRPFTSKLATRRALILPLKYSILKLCASSPLRSHSSGSEASPIANFRASTSVGAINQPPPLSKTHCPIELFSEPIKITGRRAANTP